MISITQSNIWRDFYSAGNLNDIEVLSGMNSVYFVLEWTSSSARYAARELHHGVLVSCKNTPSCNPWKDLPTFIRLAQFVEMGSEFSPACGIGPICGTGPVCESYIYTRSLAMARFAIKIYFCSMASF